MRYWLTTQSPAREGDPQDPRNIYVYDGVQHHLVDRIQPGDWVFAYETRTAPRVVEDERRSLEGREGIVLFSRLTTPLKKRADFWLTYSGGRRKNWCWRADTSAKKGEMFEGFVPRRTVNRIMGWKPKNPLRGLGRGSGVIEVHRERALRLLRAFDVPSRIQRMSESTEPPEKKTRVEPVGGESEAHKRLKHYVADAPERALGERGLRLVKEEYGFPTGDCADVMLRDGRGRFVAVEVELEVGDDDLPGLLQALKYRSMVECFARAKRSSARSVLVAHGISRAMLSLCRRYGVRGVVIPRGKVARGRR